MKRMLLATSGALALLLLLSGTVLARDGEAVAPEGVSAGAPAMNADADFGYYIWTDGNRIHLHTTDRGNGPGPSTYTGTITANGDLRDIELLRTEEGDGAVAAGNQLDFHFRTYNGTDGVAFTAHDATRITFRLFRDGQLVHTDHIYLGAGQVNPPGNPFALFI